MIVFDKIANLKAEIEKLKAAGKKIGFVPTMGALHDGHVSLIDKCAYENDIAVASIFVNPIQFNNQSDLQNYPRTIEKDLEKLECAGCDLAFVPSVEEMYPTPATEKYNFGSLETVMEGQFRPGHFNGVAVVVRRLFDIVTPDRAYFGQKDFQQLTIIRTLVKQCNLNIEIVACPIIREADGLAMSSRNMLLSPERRQSALMLSKALFSIAEIKKDKSVSETKDYIVKFVESDKNLKVDYFEIVDNTTLQSIENWNDSKEITACIAVQNGDVRLIDNMPL